MPSYKDSQILHKLLLKVLPLGKIIASDHMKSLNILIVLLLATVSASASDSTKVSFVYQVNFDMNFDNREVDRSRFTRSMTVFGARLTPSVGLSVSSADGYEHRLMAGVDIMKDFGDSRANADLMRELSMYYRMKKNFRKTGFEMYAGIFPRRMMDDRWSEVFFSDSLRFYDNNLEGILMKFHRPKASYEIGCDWMGKYGAVRRERFMIFSSGEGRILPVLSFGYSAFMYHYAGSEEVWGVVDNILLNPYVRVELGAQMNIQRFSLRLGWLQGMQNDRRNIGIYSFPCGGEFEFEARHWNAGIRNRLFYGVDMMPYYNSCDAAGYKYGSDLYPGDPFYRVHDYNNAGAGIYDRLEAFWEPYVGEWLKVKLAAVFHFNGGGRYSGCQQIVTLNFMLDPLF